MRNPPLILVADDEKDFRDIVVAKLTSKGFAVKTANDGVQAIKVAQESKPDLVLMDVQMPNKDGIATTIELQSNPATKNLKVIFLTNLGDSWPSVTEVNRKFAQQIGAAGYFKKSGDFDELIAQIRKALAQ